MFQPHSNLVPVRLVRDRTSGVFARGVEAARTGGLWRARWRRPAARSVVVSRRRGGGRVVLLVGGAEAGDGQWGGVLGRGVVRRLFGFGVGVCGGEGRGTVAGGANREVGERGGVSLGKRGGSGYPRKQEIF